MHLFSPPPPPPPPPILFHYSFHYWLIRVPDSDEDFLWLFWLALRFSATLSLPFNWTAGEKRATRKKERREEWKRESTREEKNASLSLLINLSIPGVEKSPWEGERARGCRWNSLSLSLSLSKTHTHFILHDRSTLSLCWKEEKKFVVSMESGFTPHLPHTKIQMPFCGLPSSFFTSSPSSSPPPPPSSATTALFLPPSSLSLSVSSRLHEARESCHRLHESLTTWGKLNEGEKYFHVLWSEAVTASWKRRRCKAPDETSATKMLLLFHLCLFSFQD